MKQLCILLSIFFIISCNLKDSSQEKGNLSRFFSLQYGGPRSEGTYLQIKGQIQDSNNKPMKNIVLSANSTALNTATSTKPRANSSTNPLQCTDYNHNPGQVTCLFTISLNQYGSIAAPLRLAFTGQGREMKQIARFYLINQPIRFVLDTALPDGADSYTLYGASGQVLNTLSLQDFSQGAISDNQGNFSLYLKIGQKYSILLKNPEGSFASFTLDLSTITNTEQIVQIQKDPSQLSWTSTNGIQLNFSIDNTYQDSSSVPTAPIFSEDLSQLNYYSEVDTNTETTTTPTTTPTTPTIILPSISYTPNIYNLTKGIATNISAGNTGGTVDLWSISPALPTGLSFDTTSGSISGTPSIPLSATVFTVSANNAAGSTTTTLTISVVDPATPAPSALSYTGSPYTFTQGTAISNLTPTVSGTVSSYSISPAFPGGLSFNTATGVISGNPTGTQTATDYTISATNAGGSTSTTINITINPQAPTALSYAGTPYTFTRNTAISAQSPTVTGIVTSYSVAPELPSGLSLNNSTGVISGTPDTIQASANYTITAHNISGSTNYNISITVNDAPPSALSYAGTPYIFTKDASISNLTPTVTGTVISYSISPALPAGLNFNTTNGVISGTPTSTQAANDYTITASNSYGSTNFTINITVQEAAPSALSYAGTPYTFTQGTAISSLTPTVTGTVTSYSASPTLPAGLIIDSGTGVISGTPTATQAANDYTITASNSYGSTNFTINITVQEAAPSALSYAGTPYTFTQGTAISNLTPTITGTVTSYSASPTLPAGLIIDSGTGVISGTPTGTQAATAYTITASNATGNTTYGINITVNSTSTALTGTRLTTALSGASGGSVNGYGIDLDSSGNIYIGGTTDVAMDSQTLNGSTDAFIIKYNSAGVKQWTRLDGVASKDTVLNDMAVDSAGNSYMAGKTFADLNTITCPAKNNNSCGFIVKYDTNGTRQWTVVHSDANATNVSIDAIVASDDAIYVSGDFPSGENWNGVVCNTDARCTFISKYNSADGAHVWTNVVDTATGSANYIGDAIALDSSAANVFISGYVFNTLGGQNCTSTPCLAVIKYNASGTKQWSSVVDVDSNNTDNDNSLAVDSGGNVYIGAKIDGGVTLDSQTCNASSSIYYCATLIKINSAGTMQWGRVSSHTGSSMTQTNSITTDGSNIYITGYTDTAFDSQTLTGSKDLFIMKYDTEGTLGWTKLYGATSSETIARDIIYKNNNLYTTGYTTGALGGKTLNGLKDVFYEKYE